MLCDDQGIIQNNSAKSTKLLHHFICPHHISGFDFFDKPTKIERIENGKNRVFDRSDGGQDNPKKDFLMYRKQV
jgi:hypothetical protein